MLKRGGPPKKDRDSLHSEAGNAVQEITLLFQLRLIIKLPLNLRINIPDGLFKEGEMSFNAGTDLCAGGVQPVHFLRLHTFKGITPCDQGALI